MISYQLYSSRRFRPLADTLAMLSEFGYRAVEGYDGLFDDPEGLRAQLDAAGLEMPTAHFGLELLEADPRRAVSIAATLGIGSIFCPFIPPEVRPQSAAGWREFGARLEQIGTPYREQGMTFGWHNHDFEFAMLPDGSAPMSHVLEGGPSLAWEADFAWIARARADPLQWIESHGERIVAAHVKDLAPPGENLAEGGWADIGHGTLDWPALLAALRQSPVRALIAEHDEPSDHARFAKGAIAFLQGAGGR